MFFYIHIDRKAALPVISGDRIEYIRPRVDVHWSGFSQVTATLLLMEAAVKDGHDYYAYISGVDYPIKPNHWLKELLAAGGEYIHIHRMGEDPFAPLSRYKYYYFTDHYNRRDKASYRTRFFTWLQKKLRSFHVSKQIPFPLFTGASWFVLSKNAVGHILKESAPGSRYVSFFKWGFCSDEAFFQTIIGNSSFAGQIRGYLTYADWSVDPGPAVLDERWLPALAAASDKFFARKFTDASGTLTASIDKQLRNL